MHKHNHHAAMLIHRKSRPSRHWLHGPIKRKCFEFCAASKEKARSEGPTPLGRARRAAQTQKP